MHLLIIPSLIPLSLLNPMLALLQFLHQYRFLFFHLSQLLLQFIKLRHISHSLFRTLTIGKSRRILLLLKTTTKRILKMTNLHLSIRFTPLRWCISIINNIHLIVLVFQVYYTFVFVLLCFVFVLLWLEGSLDDAFCTDLYLFWLVCWSVVEV